MGGAPLPGTWKAVEPSSKVVQHAFVNARVHEINREGASLRAGTIQAFKDDPILGARLKGYSSAKKQAFCEDAYDRLTRTLQGRNLTINFKADSWFTTENRYESYAQMYERAMKGGRMILDDSDKKNPANIRVAADDRVTFPAQWAASQPTLNRGQQGAVTLSPRGPSTQQIAGRMMAGKSLVPIGQMTPVLNPVPMAGEYSGYESGNRRFDPKTKQVFSAVNYGRRPHGASTAYGMSYFILSNKLKVDAIYFPEDTFYAVGASLQVSYQELGGLYLKAKPQMRREIVQSCFDNLSLPDTDDGGLLMEAHIFQPVRFADGLSAVVLEENASPAVVQNAKTFCRKWGITLTVPGKFEFKGR